MTDRENNVEEAFKTIMKDGCNGMDIEKVVEIMAETVMGDHRTLQQNMCKVLQGFLAKYACSTYYDGRNEASVDWAIQARKLNDEHYLPLI